jgi:hypothetical protein
MAVPLNTCTTIEQRGIVRFFVSKKYRSKGYPQRNAAHEDQCATCPILRKSMPIFNNTAQQLSPQTVLCIVYKTFW